MDYINLKPEEAELIISGTKKQLCRPVTTRLESGIAMGCLAHSASGYKMSVKQGDRLYWQDLRPFYGHGREVLYGKEDFLIFENNGKRIIDYKGSKIEALLSSIGYYPDYKEKYPLSFDGKCPLTLEELENIRDNTEYQPASKMRKSDARILMLITHNRVRYAKNLTPEDIKAQGFDRTSSLIQKFNEWYEPDFYNKNPLLLLIDFDLLKVH